MYFCCFVQANKRLLLGTHRSYKIVQIIVRAWRMRANLLDILNDFFIVLLQMVCANLCTKQTCREHEFDSHLRLRKTTKINGSSYTKTKQTLSALTTNTITVYWPHSVIKNMSTFQEFLDCLVYYLNNIYNSRTKILEINKINRNSSKYHLGNFYTL